MLFIVKLDIGYSFSSSIDQIFSLTETWEKIGEYNQTTWIIFIDFKAAYDTVVSTKLLTMMKGLGIPRKLVRLEMCIRDRGTCPRLGRNAIIILFTDCLLYTSRCV